MKTTTSNDIAKLVEAAMSELISGRIAKELKAIMADLEAKKAERKRLKEEMENKDYSDPTFSMFLKTAKKDIDDVLRADYVSRIELKTQDLAAAQVGLDTAVGMQLDLMRVIAEMEFNIRKLISSSENHYGDAQQLISDEIVKRDEDLISKRTGLEKVSANIVEAIYTKASIEGEIQGLKNKVKALELELSEMPKNVKCFSVEKTLDNANLLALEAEIDLLEERKNILKTDPENLGEEILHLLETSRDKETVLEKYAVLQKLAIGTSVDLSKNRGVSFVAVPNRQTLGGLKALTASSENDLLYLRAGMESKMAGIIKMASSAASCIRLINEAKLLLEDISSTITKEPPLRASELRRIQRDTEEIISRNNLLLDDYLKNINNGNAYVNESLGQQILAQSTLATATIQRAQMEMVTTTVETQTVESKFGRLSAKAVMLNANYADFLDNNAIDAELEKMEKEAAATSVLSDLSGERYTIEKRPLENNPELSSLNPNSFKGEPLSEVQPTTQIIEPIPIAKPIPSLNLIPDNPPIEEIATVQPIIPDSPAESTPLELSLAEIETALPIEMPKEELVPITMPGIKASILAETLGIADKRVNQSKNISIQNKLALIKMAILYMRANGLKPIAVGRGVGR